MTLALNTTMRATEIRHLCWRDVDLMQRKVTVRRSKTDAGERVIPLDDSAYDAVLELRQRSKLMLAKTSSLRRLVDGAGFEPAASSLRTRRSAS